MNESRFERTAIGLMCLECGANSVDVDSRQDSEETYLDDFTCRICGHAEEHHHDIE